MIFSRISLQMLAIISVVRSYYFNEQMLEFSKNMGFKDGEVEYVINEEGPLGGSLLFLLSECRIIDNLLSVFSMISEDEEICELQDLFKGLAVKRSTWYPLDISISNYFFLRSWNGRCVVCVHDCGNKHKPGNISVKPMIEILKEGYKSFWTQEGKDAMIEKMKLFESKLGKQNNIDTEMLDLIEKFIRSRYFLLCAYLCTHIQSPEDLWAIYNPIFSLLLESRNHEDGFFHRCFEPSNGNGKNLEEHTKMLVLAVRKFGTLPYPAQFPVAVHPHVSSQEYDEYVPHYEKMEGYVYALARCLCRSFELEEHDFTKGNDKDVQALLKHCLSIGFVGDFNSPFKDRLIRMFREKINKEGHFSVDYDEDGRIRRSLDNFFGVFGNFFEKFLKEMGLSTTSIVNLKDEYNKLQDPSNSSNKEPRTTTLSELISRMFNVIEREITEYKLKTAGPFKERIGISFENVLIQNGEFSGDIRFRIYNGDIGFFEFFIGLNKEEDEDDRFEVLSCGEFSNASNVILSENSILSSLAMMLSILISVDGFRRIAHHPGVVATFKEFPLFILLCGNLYGNDITGYYILDTIYRHLCFVSEMRKCGPLHRKVVELMFTSFISKKSNEFTEDFLEIIQCFIGEPNN